MSDYLKPCPFCGAEADPIQNLAKSSMRPRWATGCSQFCMGMYRSTRKQLVEDWNKRTLLKAAH